MRIANPIDFAARNVRAATVLAPARPAYAAGLRAALATVVPLAAAQQLGIGGGATWMSLAGFTGALADRGGAYGARAAAIASLALFGAVSVALGTLGMSYLPITVLLTFAVGVVCSLGRAWGNTGAIVGGAVLNIFVISLAYPAHGIADAAGRAGYILLGGAWAALLSLVLWPLRPYRPARLAVAACFRALADYVTDVVNHLGDDTALDDSGVPAGSLTVPAALENARATLATIRRGRPGESGRGERLLVLSETADKLFGTLVALIETIDAIPSAAHEPQRRIVLTVLGDVIGVLRAIADHVEEERQSGPVAVPISGAVLRESLTRTPPGGSVALTPDTELAHAGYAHAAILLDRVAMFASVAAANVAALDGGHTGEHATTALVPIPEAEEIEERQSLLAPLRSVLGHDSLVLRHALRVGLVTAAAVWLAAAMGLTRGYWVTITVVLILQPYTGVTTQRALQRVLGTVLGGILTAALGALFHDPRAILVFSFIFAGVSVALLPLNYAAFSVFLTPTFVLLAEASAGDWHLAGVRVVDTLLGGGLALLGALFLWPAPEWKRLPGYLAGALQANRAYLRTVVDAFPDRGESASRLMRARRRDASLAAINAEESFQRLLGEQRDTSALAPVMTFLTFLRRFTVSIAALAVSRHAVDPSTATALERFAGEASAALDAAAARLAGEAPIEPEPLHADRLAEAVAGAADHDPVVRARLTRLSRQLEILVDAAKSIASLGATHGVGRSRPLIRLGAQGPGPQARS